MSIVRILELAFMVLAGMGLSILYFWTLWLTVKYSLRTRHGFLLVVGSYVLRIALVLVAMILLSGGDIKKLLACFIGFLIVRFVVLSSARAQRWTMLSEGQDEH
mgnify:CR=1 FL=1